MYLMYVDECGDVGMGQGASNYFILSAIVIHESQWTDVMTRLYEQRLEFEREYGLPANTELHAGEMVGRSGKLYSQIGKRDRILMLRKTIRLEAEMTDSLRVINVVNEKRNKRPDYDVFATTWDALINRFENTIERGNFPHPGESSGHETGLIIVDETDEKKLRKHVRRMRHGNYISSKFNPGEKVRHDLRYVIEDPLHKRSDTSMLIQTCDVNSYFLKQTLEPNATVIRHKARNLFYDLKPVLLTKATAKDELGIVRL